MLVEIIRPNGTPYRQVEFKGERFLVAPKKGRYHIRLTNDSHARVMAVVSVDGLNIIHGKECSRQDQGYVLDPWQRATIKGWTRTDDEVAEFKFTAKDGSYSAKMGKGTKNTSVIGVAVFEEKPQWRGVAVPEPAYEADDDREVLDSHFFTETSDTYREGEQTYSCNTISCNTMAPLRGMKGGPGGQSLGSSSLRSRSRSMTSSRPVGAKSKAPDLGTAYGKKTEMHTTKTTFYPKDHPEQVISIRYATHAKLKEWGVPLHQKAKLPNPFPAEPSCPEPPGWRG